MEEFTDIKNNLSTYIVNMKRQIFKICISNKKFSALFLNNIFNEFYDILTDH